MAVSSSDDGGGGGGGKSEDEAGGTGDDNAKAALLRALIDRTWALLDEAAPVLSGELQAQLQPLLHPAAATARE